MLLLLRNVLDRAISPPLPVLFASDLAARHVKQTARAEPSYYLIVDAFLAADLRALVAEEQVVERVEGVGGAWVVRVENVLILWFGLRGAFGRHETAATRARAGVVCVWERCRHEEDWAVLLCARGSWLASMFPPRHSCSSAASSSASIDHHMSTTFTVLIDILLKMLQFSINLHSTQEPPERFVKLCTCQ